MKKILLFTLTAAFLLISFQAVNARIKLPAIVSSNMVLQRNANVTLWGWADPNEQIEIKTSWLTNTLELKADKEGNWRVEVKTTNSKEPQIIEYAHSPHACRFLEI
jgi:sialate O-acetylesterase